MITGNREGQVESVVIDDSMSYMCRVKMCFLVISDSWKGFLFIQTCYRFTGNLGDSFTKVR